MLFSKNKTLREVIDTQIDRSHYERIEKWKAIYAGYLKDIHDYKEYSIGKGSKLKRRKTLNMAKVATQELASLIFTEKVVINIADKDYNENINNVFEYNNFNSQFENKLEQMFALGGLVLKAHVESDEQGNKMIKTSYVLPDCFIPITYDNGEVTEAAFLNVTTKGDKVYYLFEIHKWETQEERLEDGEKVTKKVYVIKNVLYEGDKTLNNSVEQNVKRVPLKTLYDDLAEEARIENLTQTLFAYARPAVANNFNLQSPLGISLFANAIDTLETLDIAFDSFNREFRLGKRRILVPAAAIRTVLNKDTGTMERYFDSDDEVYQAMNYSNPDEQKIIDNTVTLRVEEHISAINALLDLYAMQIGMSTGTFVFDGKSIKTATEVISEKSKTFKTKQSNENIIEGALKKFINIIGELAELYEIFERPESEEGREVELQWDDSIIQDRDSDSDFYLKLMNSDLTSKKYTLMSILNVTEEQAIEMLKEVMEEQATRTPSINNIIDNDLDNIDELGDVE